MHLCLQPQVIRLRSPGSGTRASHATSQMSNGWPSPGPTGTSLPATSSPTHCASCFSSHSGSPNAFGSSSAFGSATSSGGSSGRCSPPSCNGGSKPGRSSPPSSGGSSMPNRDHVTRTITANCEMGAHTTTVGITPHGRSHQRKAHEPPQLPEHEWQRMYCCSWPAVLRVHADNCLCALGSAAAQFGTSCGRSAAAGLQCPLGCRRAVA